MGRLFQLRLSGRKPLQVLFSLLGELLLVDLSQQEGSFLGEFGFKLLVQLRQLFYFRCDSLDLRAAEKGQLVLRLGASPPTALVFFQKV